MRFLGKRLSPIWHKKPVVQPARLHHPRYSQPALRKRQYSTAPVVTITDRAIG